jgi:NAD(P)-dependent dehydrogenase (short-subunit alcohol dehydrogenase family)
LTKQAAWSCAKLGYKVRVNSIHPYFVWTPMVAARSIAEHGSEEAAIKKLAEPVPLGCLGEPDDVAWAVVYLASNESKFVTASDLVVDGGVTAS